MSPVRKRKPMNRKKYVKSEKAKKRRAKRETEEDMNQNFRIKEVEKKVNQLTKSQRNFFKIPIGSSTVATLVGIGKNNAMTNSTQLTDLNVLTSTNIGGVVNYDGVSSVWKHIELRYYINQSVSAEVSTIGNGTTVRVMVFCLHKPASSSTSSVEDNATLPTWAEIFADNDADATAMASSDICRGYSRLNRSNIEILYDKFHVLSPMQGAVITAGNVPYGKGTMQTGVYSAHLYPSKRFQEQTYNNLDEAPLGSYQDVNMNQYWVAYFTDNPDNTTPPSLLGTVTVDYLM